MDVHQWFLDFVATFEPLPPFLTLKRDHSLRVAAIAQDLSRTLARESTDLDHAAGLLHDVGRFAQHTTHHTVHDTAHTDHGEAGYHILSTTFPFHQTPLPAAPILDTARHHNKRTLPPTIAPSSLPTVLLVRDADKIDILDVIRTYITTDRLAEIYPDTSPTGPPSPALTELIAQHHRPPAQDAPTLADLLLTKLAWVYDFNYPPSLTRVAPILRWYIDTLATDHPATKPALDAIHAHIDTLA